MHVSVYVSDRAIYLLLNRVTEQTSFPYPVIIHILTH